MVKGDERSNSLNCDTLWLIWLPETSEEICRGWRAEAGGRKTTAQTVQTCITQIHTREEQFYCKRNSTSNGVNHVSMVKHERSSKASPMMVIKGLTAERCQSRSSRP